VHGDPFRRPKGWGGGQTCSGPGLLAFCGHTAVGTHETEASLTLNRKIWRGGQTVITNWLLKCKKNTATDVTRKTLSRSRSISGICLKFFVANIETVVVYFVLDFTVRNWLFEGQSTKKMMGENKWEQ